MGVVQGLTKARMLAIEAACIVGGTIVGNDLFLTRHDGSTLDAGNVRGPQGIQGPAGTTNLPVYTGGARPAAPTRGMAIFDGDTGSVLVWYGATTGWRPPWNTAWGEVAAPAIITVPQTGITTEVDITGATITATTPAARRLLIQATGHVQASLVDDTTAWLLYQDGVAVGQGNALCRPVNWAIHAFARAIVTPTAASHTWKLRMYHSAGSGTTQTVVAAGYPLIFSVSDIGPNGNAPAA